eukprot:TRINITY_DN3683_c0_g1_i1.p1 TRINITY_DN3683_c0_g1~~TRINITY_DN3683_c0_g1_i1.p1  ORF type:complete len:891 (+),score=194.88 TRINITY_DN3683_c0_g1_i1:55-2727(+)
MSRHNVVGSLVRQPELRHQDTGLAIVTQPEEKFRAKFAGLFDQKYGYAIIHYLKQVVQISSRGKRKQRCLLITNSALYITRKDAVTRRCVAVHDIEEIMFIPATCGLVFRIPQQYDIMIELPPGTAKAADELHYILNILNVIHQHQRKCRANIRKIDGKPKKPKDFEPPLQMDKPKNFKHFAIAIESIADSNSILDSQKGTTPLPDIYELLNKPADKNSKISRDATASPPPPPIRSPPRVVDEEKIKEEHPLLVKNTTVVPDRTTTIRSRSPPRDPVPERSITEEELSERVRAEVERELKNREDQLSQKSKSRSQSPILCEVATQANGFPGQAATAGRSKSRQSSVASPGSPGVESVVTVNNYIIPPVADGNDDDDDFEPPPPPPLEPPHEKENAPLNSNLLAPGTRKPGISNRPVVNSAAAALLTPSDDYFRRVAGTNNKVVGLPLPLQKLANGNGSVFGYQPPPPPPPMSSNQTSGVPLPLTAAVGSKELPLPDASNISQNVSQLLTPTPGLPLRQEPTREESRAIAQLESDVRNLHFELTRLSEEKDAEIARLRAEKEAPNQAALPGNANANQTLEDLLYEIDGGDLLQPTPGIRLRNGLQNNTNTNAITEDVVTSQPDSPSRRSVPDQDTVQEPEVTIDQNATSESEAIARLTEAQAASIEARKQEILSTQEEVRAMVDSGRYSKHSDEIRELNKQLEALVRDLSYEAKGYELGFVLGELSPKRNSASPLREEPNLSPTAQEDDDMIDAITSQQVPVHHSPVASKRSRSRSAGRTKVNTANNPNVPPQQIPSEYQQHLQQHQHQHHHHQQGYPQMPYPTGEYDNQELQDMYSQWYYYYLPYWQQQQQQQQQEPQPEPQPERQPDQQQQQSELPNQQSDQEQSTGDT